MKKMTCKQLGGACDEVFEAKTFDDMARLSQEHGMTMFQQQDAAHLEAMAAMKTLMENPEVMQAWFEARKKEFEALPDNQ